MLIPRYLTSWVGNFRLPNRESLYRDDAKLDLRNRMASNN